MDGGVALVPMPCTAGASSGWLVEAGGVEVGIWADCVVVGGLVQVKQVCNVQEQVAVMPEQVRSLSRFYASSFMDHCKKVCLLIVFCTYVVLHK